MNYIRSKNKHYKMFIAVCLLALLCSCFFVGTMIAWLARTYSYTDDNNEIGKVEMAIYANGTQVTGTTTTIDDVSKWTCNEPYEISGSTTNRDNIDFKIRNIGTIKALIRTTISIYFLDESGNHVNILMVSNIPSVKGYANIEFASNWISGLPSPTVACGYMYYNSQLEPYSIRTNNDGIVTSEDESTNEIGIINSILLSDSQKTETLYLSVTVDAVAYAGNIYKKVENGETGTENIPVEAYPFGIKDSLPNTWTAWR